jgi:hypothetical protein
MNLTSTSALLLTLAALAFSGCTKDQAPPAPEFGEFSIHLDNSIGNDNLVLGTNYQNAHGDQFSVSTLKYYISNIQLRKADNSTYAVPESYFLVDHATPATQELTLKDVPVGNYTGMSFIVGVDSTRSMLGPYPGVLGASYDMFWEWSHEHINLRLVGHSPQSPNQFLTYDVAGFRSNNTIRTVAPSFGSNQLLVRTDHSPEIHMHVDLLKLFTGPHLINFATTYDVSGGPDAARLADNLAAGMFSVAHIHAN